MFALFPVFPPDTTEDAERKEKAVFAGGKADTSFCFSFSNLSIRFLQVNVCILRGQREIKPARMRNDFS